jgi:hypothetical protein
MASSAANFGGEMIADLFTGSGAGLTTNTVPRTSIVTDTAYAVVVNDASGYLTEITPGTAGRAFMSNGASVLPSYQVIPSFDTLTVQVFAATGTYTPTTGMKYCIVEICGGGGGGGGAGGNLANSQSVGGGGAAGGYAKSFYPASTIGANKAVTIGAFGAGGTNTGGNGGAGTASTFGALMTANGGPGGNGLTAQTGFYVVGGGLGGTASGGNIYSTTGSNGRPGISMFLTIGASFSIMGGDGGANTLGVGGVGASGTGAGNVGKGYGCGGGGGAVAMGATPVAGRAGGNGQPGYCIIFEYS